MDIQFIFKNSFESFTFNYLKGRQAAWNYGSFVVKENVSYEQDKYRTF